MNSVSSDLVVIFSKSADAENVKTRLRTILTPEHCLSLHLALLKDTLNKVREFPASLYLTGSGRLPFDPGVPVRFQTGADLGARMQNAFEIEFQQRHSKVVIIGTDSPTVPAEQLSKAFAALDENDIVLGPCEDGGYYLIGLRKIVPAMFSEIPWGTQDVLKRTLERISADSYFLLDSYFDVDLPGDLIKLKSELERENNLQLKNVRDWMSSYFGDSAR